MKGIHIASLEKRYGKRTVLHDLHLDLEPGQIVGLLGPNGEGKTTLLKILAGLIRGYKGEVEIHGIRPGEQTATFVAYQPATPYFLNHETPGDYIQALSRLHPRFDAELALRLMQRLQVNPQETVRNLSTGMQEKAVLALTLARNADVYLLDEPFGGIDPVARETIVSLLLEEFREQSLIILSTHLVRDLDPLIDRALFLKGGQLVEQGECDALRNRYGMGLNEIFQEVYR